MSFNRIIPLFIILAFGMTSITPCPAAFAQETLQLPVAGTMVGLTQAFHPVMIQGMRIHPKNPLQFDFIVDTGDTPVNVNGIEFRRETLKLIKYFLASLTVPEDQMWVNLSPYEKNRIIANGLGITEMGRDMLAQDYLLKQLTSSLMYPESRLGRTFWEKVYAQAQAMYGRTDIPTNTFNKVWIVPDKAVVYEHGNAVYVVQSHLKVMLEEDYLSLSKHQRQAPQLNRPNTLPAVHAIGTKIIREIILPALEKEINEGKNFSLLRQIYNSMILAVWYKVNLEKSFLGQVYVDKNKTAGVDARDKTFRRKIYEQYLKSFKKGVYNYIREDRDPTTDQIIPRKYFSGGVVGLDRGQLVVETGEPPQGLYDNAKGTRVEVDSAMSGVVPEHTGSGRDMGAIKATIAQKLGVDLDSPIVDKLAHVEDVTESFLAAQAQHRNGDKTQELLATIQSHGPPKIAEIHFSYPPPGGGVHVVMAEEVKWLTDQGIPVKIISGTPSNIPLLKNQEYAYIGQLSVMGVSDPTTPQFQVLEREIYERVTEQITDQDIIIIHNVMTVRNNLPFTVALYRIIVENPQKEFIIYIHNAEDSRHEQYPFSLLNPTLDLPNVRYVTVSNSYQYVLSHIFHLPGSKFSILNPGVHPYSPLNMTEKAVTDFKKNGLLGKDRVITMIFPTRMDWNKDFGKAFLILDALNEKMARGVKLVVAVPGVDSFDKLIEEARAKMPEGAAKFLEDRRFLENKIIFLDPGVVEDYQQHRQYILDIIALSDFLLYPTEMETFGMFVIEAATTGTDIITTDLPSHQESLGEQALLFGNQENIGQIVEKIERLIDSYNENQASRDKMQKSMLERYDWSNLMRFQLAPLLLDVLKTRPLLSNAFAALKEQGVDKVYAMVLEAMRTAAKVPSAAEEYLNDIPGALEIIRAHQATVALPEYIYDVLRASLQGYAQSGGSDEELKTMGDVVSAVNVLSRNPSNIIPLITIGMVLKEKGRLVQARRVYEEVLKIDERNTQARIEMANIFEDEGNKVGAEGLYREVLGIESSNSLAQEGLNRLNHPAPSVGRKEDRAMLNPIQHPHPDIERTIIEGDFENHVVRFVADKVSAHIAVGSQQKPEQEVIIAMPTRDTEIAFYWKASSSQGNLKWSVENISDVVEQVYRGVAVQFKADKTSIQMDFNNKTNLMLNHIVNLRMRLYYHQNGSYNSVPEKEEIMMAHLRQLSPEHQQELEKLIGAPLSEIIIPQAPKLEFQTQKNGSHIILITKTTFDGQHHYRLRMEIPPYFRIENNGGLIRIYDPDNVHDVELSVRATTDFEPLTPLPLEEIYNEEALKEMKVNPEFSKIALNFALMFYKEKLMAGSWPYLAYYGRDTLVAARLMWPALSIKAKEMVVRSVLDRIGGNDVDPNLDGLVAVTDEVSQERFFYVNVTQKFNELLDRNQNPDVLGMFKDALNNTKRGVLVYNVLDNTFLLPGIEKRLFDDLDSDQLNDFLNSQNARGESNIETVLRNWNRILELTDPYTQSGLADRLVGRVPGAGDINWRDSPYALGRSEYAADINLSLAPISIENITTMIERLKELGIDVQSLAQEKGFGKLRDYLAAAGLKRAQEAWATAIDHFKTDLSADEVRVRLQHYLNISTMSGDKRKAIGNIIISKDEEERVTLKEFLEGKKTPLWLKGGISFTNIALGKKIMHSDETYTLMDKDLESKDLNRILDNLFAPWPIGLWNDDVGLFIANAIYSYDDNIIREFDEEGAYHGQNVVWSKGMNELITGLVRQINYAKSQNRQEDVNRLEGHLKQVIETVKKVGELGLSEVWTWEPGEDSHIIAKVFRQGTDGQLPGNPQLWANLAAPMLPAYKEALSLDRASLAAPAVQAVISRPGGIDFNQSMLHLLTRRDSTGSAFPSTLPFSGHYSIEGFTPVIIRVKLMHSLLLPGIT